jgi:23S rRNA pseudouridine1911/1915/1917 synthase
LQQWIRSGGLIVDGCRAKPKDRVNGGEQVLIEVETVGDTDRAEDIPLDIVYEDEQLVVVNKAPGLVVHPGAGNPHGTLLNALLNYVPEVADIPRAGIVHRLDKETSGLLVVAKTLETQNYLVKQIQARDVTRVYHAVVYGLPARQQGTIDGAIGRHPIQRKKMAIRADGKPARTHYRVLQRFAEHALVECRLESGRTHQIRVHMQALGYPLIGDTVYGGHYRRPRTQELEIVLRSFKRQALHACKLGLSHPVTGREMIWRAEYPEDIQILIDALSEA